MLDLGRIFAVRGARETKMENEKFKPFYICLYTFNTFFIHGVEGHGVVRCSILGGFLPSEACERQRVFPSQVAPQPHTVNAFPAQKRLKKYDENFENIMRTCKEMMKCETNAERGNLQGAEGSRVRWD